MSLFNNIKSFSFIEVKLEKIVNDREAKKFFLQSNPLSLFKNKSTELSVDLLDVLLIRNPIIGYEKNGVFYVCIGFYTLVSVKQLLKSTTSAISVIRLDKKPNGKQLKKLLQLDFSYDLINRSCINESKNIEKILTSVFAQDLGKKSIHGSEEWRELYPNIKTKQALATHLSMRKKGL